MSLDHIYLCCDDGETYKCDFVDGGYWKISIEEFQADELWIVAVPRPSGQPRNQPRPSVSPEATIEQFGLPIESVRFIRNRRWGISDYSVYEINWKSGKAFPRRLLPEHFLPRQPHNLGTGTYCCSTKDHRAKVSA